MSVETAALKTSGKYRYFLFHILVGSKQIIIMCCLLNIKSKKISSFAIYLYPVIDDLFGKCQGQGHMEYSPVCTFSLHRPQGRFSLVVAMSVCVFVCLSVCPN